MKKDQRGAEGEEEVRRVVEGLLMWKKFVAL